MRVVASSICLFVLFFSISGKNVSPGTPIHFVKHILSREFISEGVTVGDVNNDGRPDILAGAYWFEAPQWARHEISPPVHYDPLNGYSNTFLNFSMDVNLDGWTDLIRIGLPGEEAVWYENPRHNDTHWKMHLILNNAGNESPAMVDVDGDGRPDLLCNDPVAREMIWMKSPGQKGDTVWHRFVIASGETGTNRYTHGLGFADMNGDGRNDVIITKGWWEMPADPRQPDWKFHPADLGEDCSQIYQLGIKGKESRDLISASAHNYGVWWHENTKDENGRAIWKHHIIASGFSQSHGLAMRDINGDGQPDLITGKRFFAHNGKDPGAHEPAVLYWFEYQPGSIPVWIPHLIDDHSGVGLQVAIADMNSDGLPDIVVSNKNGTFLFEQKR